MPVQTSRHLLPCSLTFSPKMSSDGYLAYSVHSNSKSHYDAGL
jgi:hypothetical protein